MAEIIYGMERELLISFIVPLYNAEAVLQRCIDSILGQTIQNFEIIVIDDGSTDNSPNILRAYAHQYPQCIEVIRANNSGPGQSRNKGIALAKGQYIAFVDSDDSIAPHYTQVVANKLKQYHPDILIIGYNRMYERKPGFLEQHYVFSRWQLFDKPLSINSHPEMIGKLEGAPWLKIISRELIQSNHALLFSAGHMGEDLEVSLKWYLKAKSIVVCEDKLYNYKIRQSSLNFRSTYINEFLSVVDSVCDAYHKAGVFDKVYPELEYLFSKHLLISNMMRLRQSDTTNKYEQFQKLKNRLQSYFPHYHKNRYLREEPIYVRLAMVLSYYTPSIFRFIL